MAEQADPFSGVRARFRDRLIQDRVQLAAASMCPSCEDQIVGIVHRLAGLAGTLGYPDLSDSAKFLEELLQDGSTTKFEIEAARIRLLLGIDIVIGNANKPVP
jgi:HPt (histidine-containing phosphotransfer) domain-containing protein